MVEGTRTVVVGGAGQVGGLFVRLLLPCGPVTSVDSGQSPAGEVESITGDACRPSAGVLDAVRSADVVIFALPESAALAAITACAAAVRPGALLVETLSVKENVTPTLAETAARCGVEACGVNPMFAPELGFAGNAVAAVRVAGGPRTAALLDLISAAGSRVVELSAAEHDRIAAVLQVATHAAVLAFGSVVVEQGGHLAGLLDLAPPPHLTMLALLARITGGNPDVYWDIQAANPRAAGARAALGVAVGMLDGLARSGDHAGFTDFVHRIEDHLGTAGPLLRERCTQLFDVPFPGADKPVLSPRSSAAGGDLE
jgi:prephenate dehydrogenase